MPFKHGISWVHLLFMSPARIVLLSFISVISIGTILLMIPAASVSGGSLPFLDALFTATSATCVTGLVVVDTGAAFTTFGRTVVLLLVQIGGLGIMTVSTFFMFLISGHLGILEREILFDTLSGNPVRKLRRLLITVIVFTFIVEALGTVGLTACFAGNMPVTEAAGLGLFHSVSAFCNAGFSVFPDSLQRYQGDTAVHVIICGLIILGGIGFVVVFDLLKSRSRSVRGYFRKLSYHSRLALLGSAVLIGFGALMFFLLENSNTLSELTLKNRISASLFQSVTARTAGFHTIDISALTSATLFGLMILMFIGACPGSCGGGIKTTTFMVMLASLFSWFRMRRDVNLFHVRIPKETVSKATTIVFFSLFLIITATFLLLTFEVPQKSHTQVKGKFLEFLFEAVSAYGTVGLSTGVTEELSGRGKILISILMFLGRLGPLTLAIAMKVKEEPVRLRYLKENVLIG